MSRVRTRVTKAAPPKFAEAKRAALKALAAVSVDEIVPDESDSTRERTITHWFDDRMEPNDGNGTDPARYVRLKKLAESIAETPLEGEPCDEAPGGKQSWTDREHALERLTEIVQQCRLAVAKTS